MFTGFLEKRNVLNPPASIINLLKLIMGRKYEQEFSLHSGFWADSHGVPIRRPAYFIKRSPTDTADPFSASG
jgi:hypothetical protein